MGRCGSLLLANLALRMHPQIVPYAPKMAHYTPLRYPGGKGKLSSFVKSVIHYNDLGDGHYVEPYAGGAGIGIDLLTNEYVEHVHINDVCAPVYSFWHSAVHDTE